MLDRTIIKKHENGKTLAISLAALATAVPAIWLGGCLATQRPDWFMDRYTVDRMRESLGLKRRRTWGLFAKH